MKRLLKNSHVVILRSLGRRRISNDSFEILRFAQNDKEQKLAANGKFQQLVEGLIKQ